MSIAPTGYHEKLLDTCNDIVKHGFGKIEIFFSSLPDDKVKITINAGRSYVYFITKIIEFKKENIL